MDLSGNRLRKMLHALGDNQVFVFPNEKLTAVTLIIESPACPLEDSRVSGYPSFSGEALERMMSGKLEGARYPRRRLLQFDRVRADGEILHPYNARRAGTDEHAAWIIEIYLPFTEEWAELDESEFRALPLSMRDAVRSRARKTTP